MIWQANTYEYLLFFTMQVIRNDLAKDEFEFCMVIIFKENLWGRAIVWYLLLLENSIDSFNMLVDSFIRAHVEAKKVQPY